MYFYNNNIIKPLPSINIILYKLIKSYFNLYSNKLKRKIIKVRSRRVEIRKARRSIKSILISKSELKHTNNKIIITLYIFNGEKLYYLNKIKKIPFYKNFILKTYNKTKGLKSKLQIQNENFYRFIKKKNLNSDRNVFMYKINKYQKDYIKSFIYRSLRRELIFIRFKKLLIFNKAKFEKKYLILLTNYIKRIYNKNIEFNFVSLKYLYLNSYMFSTTLVNKIKTLSKKKKNFMIAIKKSLDMLNIPRIKPQDIYNEMFNKKKVYQNINLNNIVYKNKQIKLDFLDQSLTKYLSSNSSDNNLNLELTKDLSKLTQVFKSTKNKFLNGVRIEIAGRLSKRSSAVRSIFKIRNKGNIRNKDSSDKGLSTVVLRGYAKSNLQYNKINSKVRGGSFGLKG